MSSHVRQTILAHLDHLEAGLGDLDARRRAIADICDRLWGMGIDARLVSSHDPIRISGSMADGAWFVFQAAGERAELTVWDADPGPDGDPVNARSVAELHEWHGGFAAGYLAPEEIELTLLRMLAPHLAEG